LSTVYRADVAGTGQSIAFEDNTERWGASVPLTGMLAHAVATADVNADGWTDVFVGTFADRPIDDYQVRGADGPAPDRLLLGGPDGFRTASSFPETRGRTSGAAFVDLDADTRPDLVIARNVRDAERGRAPSEVLRNVGHGNFERAVTLDKPRGARSIGVLDYDRDGRTDLFVTEDRWSGGSSVLLHNDGEFRFSDATEAAGLPRDIAGLGVATADLTGDGTPDLFVGGMNRLFVNDGDSFAEQRSSTFRWQTFGPEDDAAGVAAGDLDRDGRADLVVGQHFGSTLDADERVPVRAYLNRSSREDGGARFEDVTEEAGLIGLPTKAPHVEIADIDNDGWPDIVTSAAVNGHDPLVFRNLGMSGGAIRFEASGEPRSRQYWPSGAVVDADHDGRLDVIMVDFDAGRPSLFLKNTGGAAGWIGVDAPAGSDVEVFASSGSRREPLGSAAVAVSTGFGAGPATTAWVGLGNERQVDVRVAVPNGRTIWAHDQSAGRHLSVRCGAG